MEKLDEILENFQAVDESFRLEMLLDYSDRLSSPSPGFLKKKNTNIPRISECQTPVYIEIRADKGIIELEADIPPESPTVRGVVSLIADSLTNIPVSEVHPVPYDLLHRLGLSGLIGSLRMRGINSIIREINRSIEQLQRSHAPSSRQ